MQTLFNFSSDQYDLERFSDAEDFSRYVASFQAIDGIELLSLGNLPTTGHGFRPEQYDEDEPEDESESEMAARLAEKAAAVAEQGHAAAPGTAMEGDSQATVSWTIPTELIRGVHARSIPHWLDFWQSNTDNLRLTFPTQRFQDDYYGSRDPNVLVQMLQEDANLAQNAGAQYLVWHVSDSSPREVLTGDFLHTNAEVIDASLEIINRVDFGDLTLLLENLWYPGLTLTDPEMTARLLQGVKHPKVGLMLDTGHLAHTNTALRTPEEAVAYIHQVLKNDPELLSSVRGIHLNLSLSGEIIETLKTVSVPDPQNYIELMDFLYGYVFRVDLHQPFIAPGVRELIDSVSPDWLTLEFITPDRATHQAWLLEQLSCLGY